MNSKHPAHVWWWILITKEFYLYIFLIRIVLHKVFNERKVKQLSHHHNGKSLYIPCFLFVCWNFSQVTPPTMSYIVNVNGIFLCATISLGLECAQRMLCHQRNGGKLSRTPGHIWFIYQRVSWSFCILGIQEERERESEILLSHCTCSFVFLILLLLLPVSVMLSWLSERDEWGNTQQMLSCLVIVSNQKPPQPKP